MAERIARVYSIPHGVDFPDTLAESILDGRLIPNWPERSEPLSLSSATIYLPTRRAARALSERLAARIGSDVVLLPKIVPLGDFNEAEDRLLVDQGLAAFDRLELQPEIHPARRRLILANLVAAWSDAISRNLDAGQAERNFARSLAEGLREDVNGFIVAASARDTLHLADALGHLIDTLKIHGKSWQDIHALVPQDLADDYWKISRDFLEIAAREWPAYCESQGVLDAAERRHKLIRAEAARLKANPPSHPVIAAGSTGTMPATAELIAAIARLPQGAVVLPGLDLDLDDESFNCIADAEGRLLEPQHPQAQLSRLIKTIGITRHDVQVLGVRDENRNARMRFMTEALRPVATTDQWQSRATRLSDSDIEKAFADVKIIEAEHEREEAIAIAIALREALETPGKTAALITPDRALAERVQSDLKRWKIEVEDSAGISLTRTPAGKLALLFAEALARDFAPYPFLALLNHPDACFGFDADTIAYATRALDIGLFRKINAPRGLKSISQACRDALQPEENRYRPAPEQRLTSADWQAACVVVDKLIELAAPYKLVSAHNLVGYVMLIEQTLKQIAAKPDNPDAWDHLLGASDLIALIEAASPSDEAMIQGDLDDFPSFVDGLMRGVMARDPRQAHPRIKIFGLLEARLLPVDLAILAGLDESVWPPEIKTDPFLNRPWRDALQLPAPERRIGQTAHDFVSAIGMCEVILTRAHKRSGAPTVASRLLQRMHAVAGDAIFKNSIMRGRHYLDYARRIDDTTDSDFRTRISPPAPVLDRDALPDALSVTRIETLRRDPYAIYARYVLKLDVLKGIEPEIGPAEIGSAFHDTFADFCKAYPFAFPDHARDELLRFGMERFSSLATRPEFSAFWWPRFLNVVEWFLEWDQSRRSDLAKGLLIEESGAWKFDLPRGGAFTLKARADRIELHKDGSFTLLDYKTGAPPSAEQVRTGLSPQLTLEAAIIKHNGFGAIQARSARDLVYVKIGTRNNSVAKTAIAEKQDIDELIASHDRQLIALVDAHWNGKRPFVSRPIVERESQYADYDHLARVKEWAMNADTDDGAAV